MVAVLAVLFASAVCASGCGVDDRTVTILSQQAGEGSEWAESPSTLDERSLIWDEGAWR